MTTDKRLADGGRELSNLSRHEWIELASRTSSLTERQAEAFYRRHVDGKSRREAADEMECGRSNIDNLEGKAESKIIDAKNLIALVRAVDAMPDEGILGICPECNKPTTVFVYEEDGPNVCEDCAE